MVSTLTIRNVDDRTHSRLRERAARHGRSVEAEVRAILDAAAETPVKNVLLTLLEEFQGAEAENLEIPARSSAARAVELS